MVVSDNKIRQKVTQVSKQVQAEDGVARAVEAFHQHLNLIPKQSYKLNNEKAKIKNTI